MYILVESPQKKKNLCDLSLRPIINLRFRKLDSHFLVHHDFSFKQELKGEHVFDNNLKCVGLNLTK